MLKAIAKPFGWLMLWLYDWTGSYGLAIILFAVLVTLILLPFMMKSKKGMMRTTRMQPRIAELQKKHEGNQQKLNEEMSRLYREEKANPMSGCLWSLIPFPIILALYQAIRFPLTIMMGVPEALLAPAANGVPAGAIYQKLIDLGYSISSYASGSSAAAYEQIFQSKFITEHFADFAAMSDKLQPIDYHFLGLDISANPNWKIWDFDFSSPAIWVPAVILFLIPFLSAFTSWLGMVISTKMNPTVGGTAQQQSTNKTMQLMMPLMSVWFCFIMPAALGIYWIVNSVLGVVRDVVLTKIYTKQMDKEDAVRIAERKAREAELERKHEETERLRAANATEKNSNTSKKKLQAGQKQKDTERRAALERAERIARRERLGITAAEEPESQVGNRRYARGRAFVNDRYVNPDGAEEATAAAAAESEFGESIDSWDEDVTAVEPAEDAAAEDASADDSSESEDSEEKPQD
ncbi:MAG: YidC/Oxa1 family membrane protein insertase [Oscillospiraceae bacterium]